MYEPQNKAFSHQFDPILMLYKKNGWFQNHLNWFRGRMVHRKIGTSLKSSLERGRGLY